MSSWHYGPLITLGGCSMLLAKQVPRRIESLSIHHHQENVLAELGAPRQSVTFSRPTEAPALMFPPAGKAVRRDEYVVSGLRLSYKTVQRDLDFMRDQLGLPIDYDARAHGFFYRSPVAQFPGVQISEGELVALFVARRALEQYRGTPFERPLRTAFAKLTAALPEQIGFGWEELDQVMSFRGGATGQGVADFQVFQVVS